MFYLDIFELGAALLFIGVVFDYLSTRLGVQLFTKQKGWDNAIKAESTHLHRFFWTMFGYTAGHIISSIIEYVALLFVLLVMMLLTDSREYIFLGLGGVIGGLFVASYCNYCRYKREKNK